MERYTRSFEELSLADLPLVGGKNASLGELTKQLTAHGISVPRGFAITVDAYEEILNSGSVRQDLDQLLRPIFDGDIKNLTVRAQQARAIIKKAGIPESVRNEIVAAYRRLSASYGSENIDVAVRSSATAEDLPDASFAGQQESFLNVQVEEAVLESCLNCFASLFTERAISYRKDEGFDQLIVKLSVGVQKMVRSDLASAGVIFTIDTESGFDNAILITSAFGLGENVVSGRVDPDEFLVFKPTLSMGFKPILRRKVGAKQQRLVYASHGTRTTNNLNVPKEEQEILSLSNDEVVQLATWALKIEDHYRLLHGKSIAMDIEWAKDGNDGQLYVVQARPETVYSSRNSKKLCSFILNERSEILLEGRAIGDRIGAGRVRLIRSKDELANFEEGEVLVADMTDPDWEPVMKRASAIVTNRGGRTCHAAIVSRELGVPCVVGTTSATGILSAGTEITVCCAEGAQGKVYKGLRDCSEPLSASRIECVDIAFLLIFLPFCLPKWHGNWQKIGSKSGRRTCNRLTNNLGTTEKRQARFYWQRSIHRSL